MIGQALPAGTAVAFETVDRTGALVHVAGTVVCDGGRRVLVAHRHWSDGRAVQSNVRRHRLTLRDA